MDYHTLWYIIGGISTVLLAACLLCGWLLLRHTIPPRYPIQITPAEYHLPSESLTLETADGIELSAWVIEHNPSEPWIIVSHGLGANRSDVLDIAAFLYYGGYNVLLFDFRGHGLSGGRSVSLGYLEQEDLKSAIGYLKTRNRGELRLGLFGLSMGGAVSLIVGSEDPAIRTVVADSIYTDLDDSFGHHMQAFYRLPPIFGIWPTRWFYRLRFGVYPRIVSPLKSMQQLRDRPVLLINGEADSRMPVSGAETLAEAGGPNTELWVIPGALHLEGYTITTKAYQQRVLSFYHKHLPIT